MTDLLEVRPESVEDSVFASCWEVTGCPRSDYLSCAAYQQRKNCYELDRVICCSKHRDNCASCPVYVAINKIPVQKIRIHMSTDRFDIIGSLYIPEGSRFSDFMNRTDRPFLVVRNATLTPVDRRGEVFRDTFVVVNKSHVILASPVEDPES